MREHVDNRPRSSFPFRRHDLLYVEPDVWALVLGRCPATTELPLLKHWVDQAWPVIVRRRAAGEDAGLVPVGVPLPPAAGKGRIALLIPPHCVVQCSAPRALRVAATVARSEWHSTIAALLSLGGRIGVEPVVVGSVLWEHLTGLTYVSPQSDLDVLWPVPARFDVLSLLSSIASIQRDAPMRIDGEIIFADGSAVSWRELWMAHHATGPATVLAKTMETVRLLEIGSLPGLVAHA